MSDDKNNNDNKENFVTYQVGDKYYIKYEGQDEKEISRHVYLHLKESKQKEFNNSTKK